MISFFTSEFMDDEINNILLELTPDDINARYTSLEGWTDLTPEAQYAVKLRYADPVNWNEQIQYICDSENYATYVCSYCFNYVESVDKSVVKKNRGDTFHRMHRRTCPKTCH